MDLQHHSTRSSYLTAFEEDMSDRPWIITDADGDTMEVTHNYAHGHPVVVVFAEEGVRLTTHQVQALIAELESRLEKIERRV